MKARRSRRLSATAARTEVSASGWLTGRMHDDDIEGDRARWYVIRCKPREDGRALEHLERQGFCCFLPRRGVEKLRHGRKLRCRSPSSPVSFYQSRPGQRQLVPHPVHPGVLHIVRSTGIPSRSRMRLSRRSRTSVEPAAACALPAAGERVRITEGCFADWKHFCGLGRR